MKFNLPEKPEPIDLSELRIGNVYKCKGGSKTGYWVVIGIDGPSVQVIGINGKGNITSATSYGRHVFDNANTVFKPREPIGFCSGLDTLEFNIEWLDNSGL